MVLSWLRTLLQQRAYSAPHRGRSGSGRKLSYRLCLEQLEERLTPVTDTWTGAGANDLWSNKANWTSPNMNGIPGMGDDLVFPAGAKQATTFNDLPGWPNFINSIQINGSGYNLTGNQLFLNFTGISNPSGTNTISMPMDLVGMMGTAAMDTSINVGIGAQLTLNGSISSQFYTPAAMLGFEGLLINASGGTLVINGGNSYTGSTTMTGGFIRVSNSSAFGNPQAGQLVLVNSGADLQLNNVNIGAIPLTLNGTGVTGRGALESFAGSTSWSGAITLGSPATIGSDTGSVLTLDTQINDTNPMTMLTTGQSLTISGTGTGGTVILGGTTSNTFTGGLTVLNSTVLFEKTPGTFAFGAPLVTVPVTPQTLQSLIIGDGTGARDTAVVRFITGGSQIPATPTAVPNPPGFIGTLVTINSDGLLDLNNFTNTIYGLTINGGDLFTGATTGLLTLAQATNNINGTGDVVSTGGGTITGNVALQGSVLKTPRIFTVNSGNLAVSALLSSAFSQQPVNKNGPGTLTLSGANNFTGAVTVNAGILNIQNATALGAAGGNTTTVVSGAVLQLQGGISVNKPLNVSGVGPTGLGAFENVSGNNFWAGTIVLATNPVIFAIDAGQLQVTGVISGAGDGITQLGSGTLILDAANTYTGVTTINGTLGASGTVAAPVIAGQLIINSGATLAPGTGVNAAGVALNPANLTVSGVGGVLFNPGSNFVVKIQGAAVGTGAVVAAYDRLTVSGAAAPVNFGTTNLTLVTSIAYAAALNQVFSIINPTGTATAVGSTFNGLPNNTLFAVPNISTNPASTAELLVTYPAAAATPVNLTYKGTVPQVFNLAVNPSPVSVGSPTTLTGSFVDPDTETHTVTINWGDGSANTVISLGSTTGTVPFAAQHTYTAVNNYAITVTVTDSNGLSGQGVLGIAVIDARIIVTGTDAGNPEVKVFNAVTGALKFDFYAFDPSFQGGVRVAVGDVNGDSIPDIITVPGIGGSAEVRVFSGVNGALIRDFYAFSPGLTTGFFVASGRDLNGGNFDDIVVAPDAGATPEVRAFRGASMTMVRDFFAYDPSFSGGVRVAVGDVNHDGVSDIITGTGPGSLPEVRVFSGTNNAMLYDFYAFSTAFPGGVYVAAADVNGDGFADIIVGAGAGSNPQMSVFSGANPNVVLQNFYPYPFAFDGGVRVGAIADLNGNGVPEELTAPGLSPSVGLAQHATIGNGGPPGGVQPVLALDGASLSIVDALFAYGPSYTGGIFVAGSNG